jgi:hypothetical protein
METLEAKPANKVSKEDLDAALDEHPVMVRIKSFIDKWA